VAARTRLTQRAKSPHVGATQSPRYGAYYYERFREVYSYLPDVLVRAEPPRPRRPGTDVILAENGAVSVIEVVAKGLNLERSVVGLSDSAMDADLKAAMTNKVQQRRTISWSFAIPRSWPQIPRQKGYRMARIYALGWYFAKVLHENPTWLADCESLELLNVEEIERLELIAAARNLITGPLDRKNQICKACVVSITAQLFVQHRVLDAPGKHTVAARGDAVAKPIIELARSWMSL
jgi:hypothetical protein